MKLDFWIKLVFFFSIQIQICNKGDPKQGKKSKSAVADGKALSLARTQLGHKVSLLIVYAERIIIISHHTKFELANLKR